MWNDSGKLDRKLYEYQTAEQVEHLKSKHHHHDLKVYNYFGQLVHEHKGNAQATETYA
jgi:hypothetical protein